MRRAVKARCRSFAVSDGDSPDAAAWTTSLPPASGIGCAGVSLAGISRSIRLVCRWSLLIESEWNCLGLEDSALRRRNEGDDPRRLVAAATTASADFWPA